MCHSKGKGSAHGRTQQVCQEGASRTSQKMAFTLVSFLSAFLTAVTRSPAGSGSPAMKRGVKLRACKCTCVRERACGARYKTVCNWLCCGGCTNRGVELDGVEGLQEEGWWVHSTCAYLKKGFL